MGCHYLFLSIKKIITTPYLFYMKTTQPIAVKSERNFLRNGWMKNGMFAIVFVMANLFFFGISTVNAADRYAVANGNWNSTSTWSATSGGSSGASIPVAGDNVFIEGGFTVTITADAACASLTIGTSTSGTLSFNINANNVDLTVSGNTDVASNGSFVVGSPVGTRVFALNIGGNLTVTGIFNMNGAGDDLCAVTFNGTNQSISGTGTYTFNDITFSNSGFITLSSNITISGTGAEMSVGSGADVNPDPAVQINGAAAAGTISGSGTIRVTRTAATADYSNQYKFLTNTLGSLTVVYAGEGNQNINSFTYGSLFTSGSGTKTITTAGFTVNFSVSIGSGTTLDVAAFTLTLSAGSILNVIGTLDFSSSTGTIRTGNNVSATLSMFPGGVIKTVDELGLGPTSPNTNTSFQTQGSGTWVTTSISTNGTVEYYRNTTSDQTITDRDYNNLTITGTTQTKNWTLTANRTINGNVLVNGKFNLSGSQTLSAKGNWTNNTGATDFAPNTTTLQFNNTSADQTINGTLANQVFYHFTVAKSTRKLIIGTTTVSVAGNGTLTMTSGNIDCGSNTFELGASGQPGTLTYTAGNIIGKFKRWFNSTGAKQFPLGTSSSSGTATSTHNALVTFTNLTNGSLTAEFIASDPGSTGLPLNESSSTINNQFTEGYWSLVAANSLSSTNYAVELTATGFSSQTFDANVRIIKRPDGGGSWTLNGTHVAATTSPQVAKRSALSGFSEFGIAAASSCPTGIAAPSPSSQTVCNNATISAISTTGQTGGTGSGFTYQWYSNSVNSNTGGTLIPSATGLTYTPPATTTAGTTYYYVVVNRGGCTDVASATASVTVNAAVNYGTITSGDETICTGGDPANIIFSTLPSGGAETFNYQWYFKDGINACPTGTDVTGWTLISGATANSYDPPPGLLASRTYAVMVDPTGSPDCGVATWASSCRKVTVNAVSGGTIGSDQSICTGGDPNAFTSSVNGSGSGTISYRWEYSNLDCSSGFATIIGATASAYDPPAPLNVTTYYRRITISTLNGVPCEANSNCVIVTVVPQPTPGTLTPTPSSSSVCPGTMVSATATAGSGGTGTITDILEYRYDGALGTWQPYISGTQLSTIGHTQVEIRTYRTSTGTGCTSPSTINIVTWAVNFNVFASFISPPATACIDEQVTYTTQSGYSNYIWLFPGSVVNVDYQVTSGGTSADHSATVKWLTTGSKTVTVQYTDGICLSSLATTNTTVNPLPVIYNVTTPNSTPYCSATGVVIQLSGSENGVNYQLKNGATNIGSPVAGTGSSISFGTQNNPGTYSVVATNASTGCVSNMNGSIQIKETPIVTVTSSNPPICTGGSSTISGNVTSESGPAWTLTLSGGSPSPTLVAPVGGNAPFSFIVSPTITTIYTLTYSGGNGCPATIAGSPITITVNISPSISASNIGPVNNETNTCGASILLGSNITLNSGTPAPTYIYSLVNDFSTTISNPYTFPVGITTIYVKAVNICGEDVESFTVTVVDNQAPLLTSCAITRNIEGCNTSAITGPAFSTTIATSSYIEFSNATNQGVATDNCAITSVTYIDVASGTCPIVVIRTWTLTDAAGNFISCNQTINIDDNTNPTGSNPAAVNVQCIANIPAADITVVTTEADNCDSSPTVTLFSENNNGGSGCAASPYIVTRVYRITDDCGNFLDVTHTLTAVDNTAPTFTRPADITIYKDASCNADTTVGGAAGDVTNEADNCSTGLQATYSDVVTVGSCQGTYTITRTWSLVDSCGNAAANQVQTITVSDTTRPTFTAPADITIYKDASCNADTTVGGAAGDVTNEADNCSTGLQATYSDVVTVGSCQGTYTITRTWSLVDSCGNAAANQVQTITVSDNTAPNITCPTVSSSYNTDPNECNATLTFAAIASDNCSGSISIIYKIGATPITFPYDFPVGNTTITATATDDCGNSASCNFTVTVVDNQIPVITCKSNQVNNTNLNLCTYTAIGNEFDPASALDNCSYSLSYSLTGATTTSGYVNASTLNGVVFNKGTTTVTWKITDISGNMATCSFDVTVNDNQLPVITCPANIINVVYNPAVCGAIVNYTAPIGTDNCPGAVTARIAGLSSGAVFPWGTTTNTFRVTDASGNSTTCSFTVTVNTAVTTTSSLIVTPGTQQYSDIVTLTATIINGSAVSCGGPAAADSVRFRIGTQVMGTVALNTVGTDLQASLTAALLELPTYPSNGQMAPGLRTAYAEFINVNTTYYNVTNANASFNISKENAILTYIGSEYFTTPSQTNCEGEVTLIASVVDTVDASRGDIRNARVNFRDGTTLVPGGGNVTVGLVNPGNIQEGIAIVSFNHTLTGSDCNEGGKQFEINMDANHYYTGTTSFPTLVTLALPGQEFVTGGGHAVISQSAGSYPATAGTKMNFGFNMKWNNSGRNIKGRINIIYRRWQLYNNIWQWRNYQIKSNAIHSMSIQTTVDYRIAYISTKANLTDVTNPLAPISLGGNLNLTFEVWDHITQNGGELDKVSVMLIGGNNLLFSSHWVSNSTQTLFLGGGNINIRNTPPDPPITLKIDEEAKKKEKILTVENLLLNAWPNPSEDQFNVRIMSDSRAPIQLKVYDINGKIVHTERGAVDQVYKFGSLFKNGLYMVEVIQGDKRTSSKLIKQ